MGDFNNIDKLIHQVEWEIARTVERMCTTIYRDSQESCPVDTGFLKESGKHTQTEVYYSTTYSDTVEHRTDFLRDSFYKNEPDLLPKVLEAIQRAIRKVSRG